MTSNPGISHDEEDRAPGVEDRGEDAAQRQADREPDVFDDPDDTEGLGAGPRRVVVADQAGRRRTVQRVGRAEQDPYEEEHSQGRGQPRERW